MEWIESIQNAIEYVEKNLTNDIQIEDIAREINISSYYFQKGFTFLCRLTIAEYIRKRRLSLAGIDVLTTKDKIIDIAMKYGYDSPDSFTKAFTRFHGSTPTKVRKEKAMVKSFEPLRIKIILEGGDMMNFKIVEKEPFKVMGISKMFKYENSRTEVPKFWEKVFYNQKIVNGTYGICIDQGKKEGQFEYMIAEDYSSGKELPDGLITMDIPKHNWAVFECVGAMPKAIQDLENKIYSDWLPNNHEYEIAADYSIEWYSNILDFPNRSQDENYYTEIWIPIRKK